MGVRQLTGCLAFAGHDGPWVGRISTRLSLPSPRSSSPTPHSSSPAKAGDPALTSTVRCRGPTGPLPIPDHHHFGHSAKRVSMRTDRRAQRQQNHLQCTGGHDEEAHRHAVAAATMMSACANAAIAQDHDPSRPALFDADLRPGPAGRLRQVTMRSLDGRGGSNESSHLGVRLRPPTIVRRALR